ncbi:alpha-amylase family glycosyl hydrolase [uncultured Draconibacterium sp.]|uniref:alpha-amylase family glycosyl hydrolase n=1 Tax=uncultured Draconibacterium sp. TaxID=1573823 RepID=UPI003261395F
MNRLFSLLIALFFVHNITAQITTVPEKPVATKAVTITFNSDESNLDYYTGELYAHTGLITDKSSSSTDWKYVIESWGNNATQPKLTNKGNGIYELEISPDILSYYSVSAGDDVLKLAFVFRSADANQQTENLYVDVYKEGLHIDISSPSQNAVLPLGDSVTISATSTLTANLKLFINDNEISSSNGTIISTQYIFENLGQNWIIAEATADSTVRDSVLVDVKDFKLSKPETYKNGINYTSNTSAALVLWAPLKTYVYVIGDFNNWEKSDDYLMNKDGNFFWIDITNLTEGQEYAFQYSIDGNITIADPYAEKILDPWNDKYIDEAVYPNLKAYPEGKTEGTVSVLQTAQSEYQWEIEDFEMPANEKLIIYELLIRDFTSEHTYASVIEQLDYLEDLNINVLELMPVNEFDANSSWGYNPTFYFAPDKYYGPKNELKRLVDECHKRGIAVVIDMVLNHSWGGSPFVEMYIDDMENNPWYNVTSPNPVFSWGYDFNHESDATKALVDSVNSFWLNEYNVDGFRFDFTKGFTNTPGDGSGYDQPRINILKRMATEIWKRNSDALVILEHFASNTEEMTLADFGMMVWGNKNHAYGENLMGYGASLYDAVAENRGWEKPHLVTYMESHDEERLIYKSVNFGATNGDYNTKNLATALERQKLNALFFIPLPGPKMIWQFGELGYDYSINYCPNGSISDDCRTAEKPLVWDYTNDTQRTELFQVMAKLNELKQTYEEFAPTETEYALANQTKWYKLSKNGKHVVGIGNFDLEEKEIAITFPEAGKYYEFFSGDSVVFNSASQSFTFQPGEYRMYSTTKFHDPEIETDYTLISSAENKLQIYPNPASGRLTIASAQELSAVQVFSAAGILSYQSDKIKGYKLEINVQDFSPGIYFVRVLQNGNSSTQKVVIK